MKAKNHFIAELKPIEEVFETEEAKLSEDTAAFDVEIACRLLYRAAAAQAVSAAAADGATSPEGSEEGGGDGCWTWAATRAS